MIPTNEGNINGKCCFKCRWLNPYPNDSEQLPKKLAPNGQTEVVAWEETRVCDYNPDGKWIYGNVRQVCPMFELNREKWATLTVSRHEYEYRKKHPEWFGPLDLLV